MADNARGVHVSPGIYSREIDLNYAVKSLGITTLGVVGETQRGPAFQPMMIENWRDFQSMFGGTSTEKFAGSQYPKYELPYIAKSYLKESNQLQVCRVLGLSGYNAGPAWVVTAKKKKEGKKDEFENMVVAVLRSRGHYEKYHKYDTDASGCECPNQVYDKLFYEVGEIDFETKNCNLPTSYNMKALTITNYTPINSDGNSCDPYQLSGFTGNFKVNPLNRGRFKIVGITGAWADNTAPNSTTHKGYYFEYPVTLNPNDKDYILKVLGTDPQNGEAPIYVEALYDVALSQLIESEDIEELNSTLTEYQVYHKADYCGLEPVTDFITKQEESLSRKDVGKRLLANKWAVDNKVICHPYDYETNKPIVGNSGSTNDDLGLLYEVVKVGQIYTVSQYTDVNGKRHYYYKYYKENLPTYSGGSDPVQATKVKSIVDKVIDSTSKVTTTAGFYDVLVKNNADGKYYRHCTKDGVKNMYHVSTDLNDYREQYNFASTPWIVSNIKGDGSKYELNRLFRFHTISDGNSSNNEIKVSIQNIRPDEGTFDVIVRDINDVDESIVPLEKFGKCSLVPGDINYIAYKIGSFDGAYESKSKFITVEVNEALTTKNSCPAGFLGYPLIQYSGTETYGSGKTDVVAPSIKYNLLFDEDVKRRKQYFGLSSWVGVDVDMFSYKGQAAYSQEPDYLSQGFHLDSRLSSEAWGNNSPNITVDGIEGYKFDAVYTENRTPILDGTPLIGTEDEMMGSIYEYVDLRKFTVYFYGGFDGWDPYRTYRSNTDEFKMTKYKGDYNEYSGEGFSFNKIVNPESLELNQQGITSDWYAYLSAARQFANPEAVDINVFATPGIDLFNNKLLAQEIIEMIEEERADSIYVATVPDKPFGASDYIDDMYTADDMVYELEDTEIDSNYTCTYYPWIKYEDTDNNQYIMLPPTKDVVRNMAKCDNTAHPWFVPAGVSRGDVNCVRAHYITKLADEDVLYEGRINPIKTFASDGVKIWGQKNLQIRESQLNRIAVRRLLLRMRKLISIACIGLIFEPNDATTKNKFLSTVTPILDNIKSNRGISDYKIEVNDTVESRERRELPAKIYFKPINALEYITLDFIVTPEAVSFENI